MLKKRTCHVKVRTFDGQLRTADSMECTWEELEDFRRGEKMYLALDNGKKNICVRAESISPNGDNTAVDIRAVQIEDDGNPRKHRDATEQDFGDLQT
jgi:hypothetical protein